MGQPVKIMDLVEIMICLSGRQGIELNEKELRLREKLYEELLVKTEESDKTSNNMIFIERDTALSKEKIDRKLEVPRNVCENENNQDAKAALRSVVPAFRRIEEVNKEVIVEKRRL